MEILYLFLLCLIHHSFSTSNTTNITTFELNWCQGKNNNEFPQNKYFEFSIPKELLSSRFLNYSFNVQFRSIGHEPSCVNGSQEISWNKEKAVQMTISPHGYLKYNNRVYKNNQFCLTNFDEKEWQFKICNDTCSTQTPCVYKCCDPDEVWDVSHFPRLKCSPSGNLQWKPILYSDFYTKSDDSQIKTLNPITITQHPRDWAGSKSCAPVTISMKQIDDGQKSALFRVLQDGSIWRCLGKGKWVPLTSEKMCIDGIQNFSNGSTYFTGNEKDVLIFKCSDSTDAKNATIKRQKDIDYVYIIFLILSSLVLLITLVVHLLIWEKHTVHVWTQVFYIGSLCLTYVCLSAVHISSLTLIRTVEPSGLCRAIAIVTHFSFLSTFTWLSVINYDIYNTFRTLKPTSGRSKGIKKLVLYAIFGYGVPLVIVTVALTLENIYGNAGKCESSVITPDYGDVTCYLELHHAQLPYVYIPIGTLLAANLIFFTLTVYSLYFIQQSTKFATSSSSKAEKQNQSIVLFAKIFLLMGIPWIFEVISWATTKDSESVPWYWVVTDVLLICQSFSIFGIFVLKKEMCRSLDSKFPKFKKFKASFTLSEEKMGVLSRDYPTFFSCIRRLRCPCFPQENQQGASTKTQSQSLPSTTEDGIKSTSSQIHKPKTHAGESREEIEMK